MRRALLAILPSLSLVIAGCEEEPPPVEPLAPEPGEDHSGGDTTVFDVTREAFARAARNIGAEGREEFALGDHFFNRNWVTAPASAEGNDGLGPLFNAPSCSACHFKDGRGQPPEEGEEFTSILFRLSVPGAGPHGGPNPEPTYGGQLQNNSILGLEPEAIPTVTWETFEVSFEDGETAELRRPVYSFAEHAAGDFAPGTMISPRVANHLVGLGLLAALDEATIVANADPEDADGDGISGRPNWVWDDQKRAVALGRFGWKAAQPTIAQQNAAAFVNDIGITNPLYREEACTPEQMSCLEAISGGDPEVDDSKFERINFYMHTIAVPGRRNVDDPQVLRGRELFDEAGCSSCHVRTMTTGDLEGFPALSQQKIWAYTDLLLHDMGEDLADNRPDYEATGTEWRTAPLWGIGLVETVNRHEFLLHDGRARGFVEAILWHGGEAFSSREAFRTMPADDREAIVAYLRSL